MKIRRNRVCVWLWTAGAMSTWCLESIPGYAQKYTVTDLSTQLPATYDSFATGINRAGEVVGYWMDSHGINSGAMLWNGAVGTGLPFNLAFGINSAGHVVGDVCMSEEEFCEPVFWNGRVVKYLDPGRFSGPTYPVALNEAGQVVGYTFSNSFQYSTTYGLLWKGGKLTVLATLGGDYSVAAAINDRGEVVGASLAADGLGHAVLWKDTKAIDLGLGPLGGNAQAKGINNVGLVVGFSLDPAYSTMHATLWDGAKAIDLGTLAGGTDSAALGINNRGQIVGWSTIADGTQHATLWDCGNIIDLAAKTMSSMPAGSTLNSAVAINDNGWIAANAGYYSDKAFLLSIERQVGPDRCHRR
jgi:probable HAF family extracellular repeat protein